MTNERAIVPIEDTLKLAQTLAESGMFKDVKTMQQAFVKVLAGRELGIGSVEAMRGIDIIEGKLAPNAGLLAALIKRSGRYSYKLRETTAERCVIDFFENSQNVGAATYTMAEAKTAGLAQKPNWQKHPADMLFARAMTRGARRFCPDVFGGSVYSPEEIGDVIEGEAYEVPVRIVDEETGEITEPPHEHYSEANDYSKQKWFWANCAEIVGVKGKELEGLIKNHLSAHAKRRIDSIKLDWIAEGDGTWESALDVIREAYPGVPEQAELTV